MDYPCAEIAAFSFSRSGFYHADKQTRTHTDAAKCFTPV